MLLVFGALGLVGVWLAGRRLDQRFRSTALVALGALLVGVLGTGAGVGSLVLVVLAGGLWNAAFGPMASIYQTAALGTGEVGADLAGAWVVATSNLGIAGGAALGAGVLDTAGLRPIAWVAAAAVLLAGLVVAASRRAFPPHTRTDVDP